MNRYKVAFSTNFQRVYTKLTKKDKLLAGRIRKVIKLLAKDPSYKALRTHKVNTKCYGHAFSSRVTGDKRIIWDFDKNKSATILVLSIGGHSGGARIYK
jgi:mRNA-degrading endonuclease YafQ of YafQ-DinJ toxin-antitoxin module